MQSATFPIIETLRTYLRPLSSEDVSGLYEIYSDAEAMKFRANPPLKSKEEALEMVEKAKRNFQENHSLRWGVVEKNSDKLLGTFVWTKEKTKTGLVGYSLGKSCWGKGFMSEVMERMVDYLLNEEGLNTLAAWVHPSNVASVRLLKKYDFQIVSQEVEPDLYYMRLVNR
ncbi:GNAT family N-acetyltransferase [Rapidithrix thailandica]|uniref:GNAT family N-acetyltransferase n=1 Tax=Rapidithrix thailandica TaxID=413964 RepID=A0AAW9S3X9_9BACT